MRTDGQSRLRPLSLRRCRVPRAPARAVQQRPRGSPGSSCRLQELDIVAQKRQVTSVKVIGVCDDSLVAFHCKAAPGARPRARPPRTQEEVPCADSPGRRWKRPRTARGGGGGRQGAARCGLTGESPRTPIPGSAGARPTAGVSPSPSPRLCHPPSHAPPSAGGRLTDPPRLAPGLRCGRVGGAREPNCGGGRGDGREEARRGED